MFCPYDPGKIHSSSLTEKKEFLFSLYKVEHWPESAAIADTPFYVQYNWNSGIDFAVRFNHTATNLMSDRVRQVEARDLNCNLSHQTAIEDDMHCKLTPNSLRRCFAIHLLNRGHMDVFPALIGPKDSNTTIVNTKVTTRSLSVIDQTMNQLKFGSRF